MSFQTEVDYYYSMAECSYGFSISKPIEKLTKNEKSKLNINKKDLKNALSSLKEVVNIVNSLKGKEFIIRGVLDGENYYLVADFKSSENRKYVILINEDSEINFLIKPLLEYKTPFKISFNTNNTFKFIINYKTTQFELFDMTIKFNSIQSVECGQLEIKVNNPENEYNILKVEIESDSEGSDYVTYFKNISFINDNFVCEESYQTFKIIKNGIVYYETDYKNIVSNKMFRPAHDNKNDFLFDFAIEENNEETNYVIIRSHVKKLTVFSKEKVIPYGVELQ